MSVIQAIHPSLANKVAVITGGSGVLCSAMAIELARQGAKVAVLGRTLEKVEKIVTDIKQHGGVAIGAACDVTDQASVEAAAALVEEQLGCCNILINGAGGNQANANTSNETFSIEDWHARDGVIDELVDDVEHGCFHGRCLKVFVCPKLEVPQRLPQ